MDPLYVILILVGLVVVAGIVLYNRLVALRQNRENAFSDIDVQLKQRYDLVPQLVETVKGYAGHENDVFTKVTEARAGVAQAGAGPDGGRIEAENMLGRSLFNLFAVAEAYPDLKADQNFQQLQAELSDIENKIAAARRFFNNTTSELNTAIQQFPAVLIAGPLGFTQQPFFELPEEEKLEVQKAPDVSF